MCKTSSRLQRKRERDRESKCYISKHISKELPQKSVGFSCSYLLGGNVNLNCKFQFWQATEALLLQTPPEPVTGQCKFEIDIGWCLSSGLVSLQLFCNLWAAGGSTSSSAAAAAQPELPGKSKKEKAKKEDSKKEKAKKEDLKKENAKKEDLKKEKAKKEDSKKEKAKKEDSKKEKAKKEDSKKEKAKKEDSKKEKAKKEDSKKADERDQPGPKLLRCKPS